MLAGKVLCEGRPVEFLTVGLTGTSIGTITDKNGDFFIKDIPFGKYELQFSLVGYEKIKKNIRIESSVPLRIIQEIVAAENSLNTVVVTGTMQEISRSESAIPIEILTPKLFLKNPTPSLFESMQMVNGVQPQLNCNVCNTGDIHINGMEGPYTMITIDGMPIVSALSTVYGLSGIPNSLVNRIEVVKGPASTLYGSEAVGGLINIITKNPIGAPKISIDAFATTDQEYNTDIGLKFKAGKKAHSLLGINYFNFQNNMDRNEDGFTDITLQNRVSVFNKWSFERKAGRLSNVAARFVYEDRWGGQTAWSPKWRGTDSVYGESIYTSRYELIGIYQLPLSEKVFFQYSFNNHNQNSYYGTTSYMASQNIAFGQLYWTKKIIPSTELLVGLPFRYTYYDDNTVGTQQAATSPVINKPQQTYLPGVFVQTETKVKKLTLLAGLRYDYNTAHGNIFSPRLSIKYALNEENILRLSTGNGYRVVNLFTEDHAALTGAREVVIRNNLKPERSWNANLNYQRFITMPFGFLEVDASAFYTYFSNKIIGDFLADPDKIIFDNINGHAISEGVSLGINGMFTNGLKINAGATYMKVYSINKSSGTAVRTPQLHAPDFSGTYSVSYTFNKAQVTLDYTGIIKSPMYLPVVPNDYRPERSPWFTLQNLQVTKKFKRGIEIYGGVKNIFDFTPQDPILRPFDPFDKNIDENNPNGYTFDPSYNYAPMQGRRYFLGIRYTLF
jgi:outer membrane receptor for ferrienterochelin and colicins